MKTKPLAFPSVADTEAGPELRWVSGDLFVEFHDYRNEPQRVQFIDVPQFELLDESELDSTVFAYDGAIEVNGSTLIRRLVEIGSIRDAESEVYRHLVIGFNEIGAFLVVICRGLNFEGEVISEGKL